METNQSDRIAARPRRTNQIGRWHWRKIGPHVAASVKVLSDSIEPQEENCMIARKRVSPLRQASLKNQETGGSSIGRSLAESAGRAGDRKRQDSKEPNGVPTRPNYWPTMGAGTSRVAERNNLKKRQPRTKSTLTRSRLHSNQLVKLILLISCSINLVCLALAGGGDGSEPIAAVQQHQTTDDQDLLLHLIRSTGSVDEASKLIESLLVQEQQQAPDGSQQRPEALPAKANARAPDYDQVRAGEGSETTAANLAATSTPIDSGGAPFRVFLPAGLHDTELTLVRPAASPAPSLGVADSPEARQLIDELLQASGQRSGPNLSVQYDDEHHHGSAGAVTSPDQSGFNLQQANELVRSGGLLESFLMSSGAPDSQASPKSRTVAELKAASSARDLVSINLGSLQPLPPPPPPPASAGSMDDFAGLNNNESLTSLQMRSAPFLNESAAEGNAKIIANYSHWIKHEHQPLQQSSALRIVSSPADGLASEFSGASLPLPTAIPRVVPTPPMKLGAPTVFSSGSSQQLAAMTEAPSSTIRPARLKANETSDEQILPFDSRHETTRTSLAAGLSQRITPPIRARDEADDDDDDDDGGVEAQPVGAGSRTIETADNSTDLNNTDRGRLIGLEPIWSPSRSASNATQIDSDRFHERLIKNPSQILDHSEIISSSSSLAPSLHVSHSMSFKVNAATSTSTLRPNLAATSEMAATNDRKRSPKRKQIGVKRKGTSVRIQKQSRRKHNKSHGSQRPKEAASSEQSESLKSSSSIDASRSSSAPTSWPTTTRRANFHSNSTQSTNQSLPSTTTTTTTTTTMAPLAETTTSTPGRAPKSLNLARLFLGFSGLEYPRKSSTSPPPGADFDDSVLAADDDAANFYHHQTMFTLSRPPASTNDANWITQANRVTPSLIHVLPNNAVEPTVEPIFSTGVSSKNPSGSKEEARRWRAVELPLREHSEPTVRAKSQRQQSSQASLRRSVASESIRRSTTTTSTSTYSPLSFDDAPQFAERPNERHVPVTPSPPSDWDDDRISKTLVSEAPEPTPKTETIVSEQVVSLPVETSASLYFAAQANSTTPRTIQQGQHQQHWQKGDKWGKRLLNNDDNFKPPSSLLLPLESTTQNSIRTDSSDQPQEIATRWVEPATNTTGSIPVGLNLSSPFVYAELPNEWRRTSSGVAVTTSERPPIDLEFSPLPAPPQSTTTASAPFSSTSSPSGAFSPIADDPLPSILFHNRLSALFRYKPANRTRDSNPYKSADGQLELEANSGGGGDIEVDVDKGVNLNEGRRQTPQSFSYPFEYKQIVSGSTTRRPPTHSTDNNQQVNVGGIGAEMAKLNNVALAQMVARLIELSQANATTSTPSKPFEKTSNETSDWTLEQVLNSRRRRREPNLGFYGSFYSNETKPNGAGADSIDTINWNSSLLHVNELEDGLKATSGSRGRLLFRRDRNKTSEWPTTTTTTATTTKMGDNEHETSGAARGIAPTMKPATLNNVPETPTQIQINEHQTPPLGLTMKKRLPTTTNKAEHSDSTLAHFSTSERKQPTSGSESSESVPTEPVAASEYENSENSGDLNVYIKPLAHDEQLSRNRWLQATRQMLKKGNSVNVSATTLKPSGRPHIDRRKRRREPPVLISALAATTTTTTTTPTTLASTTTTKSPTTAEPALVPTSAGGGDSLDENSLGNLFSQLPQARQPKLKGINQQSATQINGTADEQLQLGDQMLVDGSQSWRSSSLSPLVDEYRTKSLVRTMLNLGAPSTPSQSNQPEKSSAQGATSPMPSSSTELPDGGTISWTTTQRPNVRLAGGSNRTAGLRLVKVAKYRNRLAASHQLPDELKAGGIGSEAPSPMSQLSSTSSTAAPNGNSTRRRVFGKPLDRASLVGNRTETGSISLGAERKPLGATNESNQNLSQWDSKQQAASTPASTNHDDKNHHSTPQLGSTSTSSTTTSTTTSTSTTPRPISTTGQPEHKPVSPTAIARPNNQDERSIDVSSSNQQVTVTLTKQVSSTTPAEMSSSTTTSGSTRAPDLSNRQHQPSRPLSIFELPYEQASVSKSSFVHQQRNQRHQPLDVQGGFAPMTTTSTTTSSPQTSLPGESSDLAQGPPQAPPTGQSVDQFDLNPRNKSTRLSFQRAAVMIVTVCCTLIIACLLVAALAIKCNSLRATNQANEQARRRQRRCDALVGLAARNYRKSHSRSAHQGAGHDKRVKKSRQRPVAAAASSGALLGLKSSHALGKRQHKLVDSTRAMVKSHKNRGSGHLLLLANELDCQYSASSSSADSAASISSNEELVAGCSNLQRKQQQRPMMATVKQHQILLDRSEPSQSTQNYSNKTIRERISGTVSSRLVRLHLHRLMPYFALDYSNESRRQLPDQVQSSSQMRREGAQHHATPATSCMYSRRQVAERQLCNCSDCSLSMWSFKKSGGLARAFAPAATPAATISQPTNRRLPFGTASSVLRQANEGRLEQRPAVSMMPVPPLRLHQQRLFRSNQSNLLQAETISECPSQMDNEHHHLLIDDTTDNQQVGPTIRGGHFQDNHHLRDQHLKGAASYKNEQSASILQELESRNQLGPGAQSKLSNPAVSNGGRFVPKNAAVPSGFNQQLMGEEDLKSEIGLDSDAMSESDNYYNLEQHRAKFQYREAGGGNQPDCDNYHLASTTSGGRFGRPDQINSSQNDSSRLAAQHAGDSNCNCNLVLYPL